jgi:hypothetical protein
MPKVNSTCVRFIGRNVPGVCMHVGLGQQDAQMWCPRDFSSV